ncbi:preprotein translocase subunit YajC [candidate division WOR-3 bacterium]|nr:preprotein translocase subunit YajC [candidate division WOR-3 bacterium]
MVETLHAMGQGGQQGQTNPITTIVFIVMIIAILYFLLFMPQRKQEQKRKQMIGNLTRGDEVVTSGGIHGTITRVKEDTIVIKIADKTEITVEKNAVSKQKEKR